MYLFNPIAKPFLKWAGGKTQLIEDIRKQFPKVLLKEEFTFIEPFVGSGAVLFWILNHFPNAKKVVINDINQDLIQVYRTIQNQPSELIAQLEELQNIFHHLQDNESKKTFYNQKRSDFILQQNDPTTQSALFIFLNKTCFNGLYRVNKKGEFNVPMGSYTKPLICDTENIWAVHQVLQGVTILNGDFEETISYAHEKTLFYLDPPYKPLNETSSFNTYTPYPFDDMEQIRLRDFCKKLDTLQFYWILSNSDMKNADQNNNFFDDLYQEFDIKRVNARRSINSKADKRGQITELLISNIKTENYAHSI